MTRVLLSRLLAVSAAVLLVGAVAAASLAPDDTTVLDALAAADLGSAASLHRVALRLLGDRVWHALLLPLLERPLWLLPASLGLLLAGGSVSLGMPPVRPRRRRS